MSNGIEMKNIQVFGIIAAAIILGVFLVFRQILVLQEKNIEIARAQRKEAPAPISLVEEISAGKKEEPKDITLIAKEIETQDLLGQYEKEDRRPNLIQPFRMGEAIPQKKVEGVEYISAVKFRRQVGTGRVLADVLLYNDSSTAVTPRFQILLFDEKGKFIDRDTVLYITEDLEPGEKKTETMSFRRGRRKGIRYFEVRQLD